MFNVVKNVQCEVCSLASEAPSIPEMVLQA